MRAGEGDTLSRSWFANFGQISFGTSDLRRTLAFWERQLGIGPWTVFRGLTMDALHEGRRISMPFDVALAWHDGRLVELIQAHGDGPSPLHDGLNRPMIGLQRLASITDDIERDAQLAERRGMTRLTAGEAGGQRFIHYRSDDAPGVILELLERTPGFTRLVDLLRRRAARYRPAAGGETPAVPAPFTVAPATMKAALLTGYGEPDLFRIADVSMPAPGPREVRIRVAGAAVNPVDVKARRGLLGDWATLAFPACLGGDVSGVIDAIGEGVSRFKVGDRVIGMINPFANGAYAQFVVAHEASLAAVPAGLDLIDAAALPTGVLTGTQLVEVGIAPRVGDRVLVTGAGGSTGRAAVLAILEAGAIPIAGVRASSRNAVADLPVEAVVDLADAAQVAALGLVDAIADTVGGEVAERLFNVLKPDGIFASIAVPVPDPPEDATQRFCAVYVRFDAERLAKFMQDVIGTGRTMPVARRFPLEEVAAAHRLMEAGGVGGKIVLTT